MDDGSIHTVLELLFYGQNNGFTFNTHQQQKSSSDALGKKKKKNKKTM